MIDHRHDLWRSSNDLSIHLEPTHPGRGFHWFAAKLLDNPPKVDVNGENPPFQICYGNGRWLITQDQFDDARFQFELMSQAMQSPDRIKPSPCFCQKWMASAMFAIIGFSSLPGIPCFITLKILCQAKPQHPELQLVYTPQLGIWTPTPGS